MLKKALERRRNPEVNEVCDEDPIPRMTVNNCSQSIVSKPITFENSSPLRNQALLSQRQVNYVEYIRVTRDTENLGM